jgi:hypothetical protein
MIFACHRGTKQIGGYIVWKCMVGKFKGFYFIFFFPPQFFLVEFLGKISQTMSKISQI